MKSVLIIGAGFLQNFVIKKAKELGYYTITIDGNPNAVGFNNADEYSVVNIVDEAACLEYAKKINIDGVLTAATDYGVLSASYIAQELGLRGIKYETAKLIKNKYEVRKRLFESGADDTGLSFEVYDKCSIENVLNKVNFPIMVKPCDGSGSRGASRVDRIEEFKDACSFAMENSLTGKATVEPFIFGEEYGAESFVLNGEVYVLGVMKKLMTKPPYYAELGHSIPSGLPTELEQKVIGCVTKAIKALDINFGSVNMDMLITNTGNVHIVDIGARMGGNLIGSHIIPIGTGIDYMENMIKAAMGDKADFRAINKPSPVSTRLLALTPGKIQALPDFKALENENVIIKHHLNVGDTINEYHTNLDGCGYVVCKDDNIKVADANAEQIKSIINNTIIRL